MVRLQNQKSVKFDFQKEINQEATRAETLERFAAPDDKKAAYEKPSIPSKEEILGRIPKATEKVKANNLSQKDVQRLMTEKYMRMAVEKFPDKFKAIENNPEALLKIFEKTANSEIVLNQVEKVMGEKFVSPEAPVKNEASVKKDVAQGPSI